MNGVDWKGMLPGLRKQKCWIERYDNGYMRDLMEIVPWVQGIGSMNLEHDRSASQRYTECMRNSAEIVLWVQQVDWMNVEHEHSASQRKDFATDSTQLKGLQRMSYGRHAET